MSEKDGGPAFVYGPNETRIKFPTEPLEPTMAGMSLRDWFAGQMLVGMRLSGNVGREEWFAESAYAMADAMLRARARPNDTGTEKDGKDE